MEELIVENGLFYFLILNYLIFKIDFLKCSLVIKYMYIVIFFLMNIYLYKEGKDINYKKKNVMVLNVVFVKQMQIIYFFLFLNKVFDIVVCY